MNSPAADQLSVAFAAALGSAAAPPDAPASLLGLEHEYSLSAVGRGIDFRQLIHGLPVPGRRLDPGDTNAYRCSSGLVLTCDEAEAEVASPPIRLRPGFTHLIEGWAASGQAELLRLLPPGIEAKGYSTHLSAAMPDALNDRVCDLYALTFAPALMLLIDGPDSHGVYVRPRPGRLELCGEYVQGARLGAAAAFLAGSARACAAADVGEASAVAQLPPRLRLRLLPAIERYGLYVGRRAFGCDLYALGRRALLTREGGGTITAQEHLDLAWQAASGALAGIATGSDLGVADRIVAGSLPLGIEAPLAGDDDGADAHSRSPVHGAVLQPLRRPGFTASAVIAVWPFTVFRLRGAERSTYACIPRSHLPQFLRRLTAGRLDALIIEYLGAPPAGRVLTSNRQTAEPGLWDEVGQPRSLLPPERDPAGSYDYLTLDAESARAAKFARPGKVGRPGKVPLVGRPEGVPLAEVPPAGPPPPAAKPSEAGRGPPWKIILPLGAILGAIAIGAGVILGGGLSGGGGASSPTPTASPTSTPAPTPTLVVVVPTAKPTETGKPTATPTSSPSPTPTPTATPAPTPTPTPTAEALCDLTITKTSSPATPNQGFITYQIRVDWECSPGVTTTTGATVHIDDALPIRTNQQPYFVTPPGPQVTLTSATSGTIACTGPPHPHPGAPGFDTNRFGCDVGILPANGNAIIAVTLETGTGQTLTNTAVVDTDNSVPESNEGNNQAQITDRDCCQ